MGCLAAFVLIVGCGSSDDDVFKSESSGGAAGAGGGAGAGGSGTAGSAGSGMAGSAGSGMAGSAGSGMAGSAGAMPTCPGTAPGCVIDWAGDSSQKGTADGVGSAARFEALGNITGDGTYLYVADNNAVRRIEIATATVTTFAGQPGTSGHNDAQGTAARFGFVDGVATDGTTLWVVDGGNNVIRAVNLSTADVSTIAGSVGMSGVQDGTGTAARFANARGMAWDGTALYIAEAGNSSVIRRLVPGTGVVTTVAGGNGQGSTDGAGNVAQFNRPRNLGAANGLLYIADTENHLIREVSLGGGGAASSTVSTPLGASAGHMDGTGTAALFRRHRGIDFDGSALIVADSDNYVIRKVDLPAYTVTTIAGTAGNQAHAVGIGAAAAFDKPMDLHFDPGTGDLFIIEGSVIRRMYYQ